MFLINIFYLLNIKLIINNIMEFKLLLYVKIYKYLYKIGSVLKKSLGWSCIHQDRNERQAFH